MANVVINDSHLTAIGNAIRTKNGSQILYKPREMAAAIEAIEVGGGGGSGDGEISAVHQSMIDIMRGNDGITVVLPKETRSVPANMFYQNSSIKHVVIENHDAPAFTHIGSTAFSTASNLKTFEWPKILSNIGSSAFYGCGDLVTDELPDTVDTIGSGAFNTCSSINFTKLPKLVTRIEANTFKNCTSLQITKLHEGITYVGNYAFSYACNSNETRDMLTLPASLKQIGNVAFGNQNFKKIRFLGTPDQGGVSASAFSYSQPLFDIYVPWTHSAVVNNAPWGATSATIHYNTSPDEVIE